MNEEIEDVMTDPVDRLLADKKPPSSGKWIAVLALLLALAAVLNSAWQWWQGYSSESDNVSQQETIDRIEMQQERLTQSVAAVGAQLDATALQADPDRLSRLANQLNMIKTELDGLQGQTGEDMASISAVQGSVRSNEQRISTVESGLTSVAARSQNSGIELEIAEIDFLLRAASERLDLFSDPGAADLALQAADVQIEALNDPMLLSVRQRIATARQALALVPQIDRVQVSAKFSSMQSSVADLPFQGEVSDEPEPELAADAGWWESLKHTLSSLVTVRRRVPEDGAILSLEDKDYLRQGLWLQLESARLALMRNDDGVYRSSLHRVQMTLEQFFENGASSVQAMLIDVATLEQEEVAPEMPDISAPWAQLRQLRDSRRLLQSAPTVESVDPVE